MDRMVRESLSEKVHLSRSLNGVREGNGNIWEKNVSAIQKCIRKGSKAGAFSADWKTHKQAVWLEQSGGAQSGHR